MVELMPFENETKTQNKTLKYSSITTWKQIPSTLRTNRTSGDIQQYLHFSWKKNRNKKITLKSQTNFEILFFCPVIAFHPWTTTGVLFAELWRGIIETNTKSSPYQSLDPPGLKRRLTPGRRTRRRVCKTLRPLFISSQRTRGCGRFQCFFFNGIAVPTRRYVKTRLSRLFGAGTPLLGKGRAGWPVECSQSVTANLQENASNQSKTTAITIPRWQRGKWNLQIWPTSVVFVLIFSLPIFFTLDLIVQVAVHGWLYQMIELNSFESTNTDQTLKEEKVAGRSDLLRAFVFEFWSFQSGQSTRRPRRQNKKPNGRR